MKQKDMRGLTRDQKDAVHIRVVEAVRRQGYSVLEASKIFGVARQSVYNWLNRYESGGKKALKCRKAPGSEKKTSRSEEAKVIHRMRTGKPEDYGLAGQLWTRESVRGLLQQISNKSISLTTTGRFLHRWNLSYQKPIKRAYERNAEQVSLWKRKEFPKIAKEALKAKASLFFTDETQVRSDHHSGRTWAPKGKTPVIETTGKRFKINAIGASSWLGDFRFMLYSDKMNSKKFISFLKRLIHGSSRPIFLITDSHPAHKSKQVREFEASTKGKLRLFFCQPTLLI